MPGKKESKADKESPEQAEAPEDSSQPVVGQEQAAEARTEAPPQIDERVVLLRRNEELLSRLMYLQAEFENYQKRALRERQDIVANAQEGLLRSLLPILDDFDKAVEIAGASDSGLKMLHAKLLKILEESGLAEIPAKGQKFDPFLHDAVEFVNDGSMEHGTIKEVIRKGYRCNMKVLRPSLVIVVKNEGEKNV
jgi:molecular chaperone GrpE